ncbi:MAG: SelB C-terminal domain-containing protein, partial [Myxococcota bacterium]
VVDVPGHERLVRTMVAGATGIDLVLLVVAADEGVMPQTREHVAICELLGITRGVVALTKIDIAEPDVAELAAEEAALLLVDTPLAGAPVVPVSGVSEEGLGELRRALRELVADAAPRTPRRGPPRLNVDRCFAAKGFGCVVTGTLVGASFGVGDSVEIQPRGRTARVRGLQHHGVSSKRGEPGVRCALNLQGVEVADVSRGDVVSAPGALLPTRTADLKLWWLAAAGPVEDRAAVEFLLGTAERRAHIAAIGAPGFEPGRAGFARVHLDGEPLAMLPGDRFIVRGFSRTDAGGSTLGGGVVLDIAPPRRRRSDPGLSEDLAALARGESEAGLLVRIRRSGLAGVALETLGRETGQGTADLHKALAAVAERGHAVASARGTWLSVEAAGVLEERMLRALDAYHVAEPLRQGMPVGTLRAKLPENVPPDVALLASERLMDRGDIAIEDDIARRTNHAPTLGQRDAALVDRICEDARAAGLEPPSERDWAQRLGTSREHLQDLLAYLKREGRLVCAPGDLWFDADTIGALRAKIVAYFEVSERLDTLQYKALIGTSRRTAVPLMEYFDDEHLTTRSGDARILRGG